MAQAIKRLTAARINRPMDPGWYPDGQGLYLQVSKTGSKSWVFRYKLHGRERRHGLGPYGDVSLAEARTAAKACRQLKRDGLDPIEHKRQLLAGCKLAAAQGISLKETALAFIELQKSGWKNPKHADQWRNTLDAYVLPKIGALPVREVDTSHVLAVIEPLWTQKTETASRVRQRIENILDFAKVRGYREGDNPARWRGHLDKLLPKRSRVQKVVHFAAMPYRDVPDYYRSLVERPSLATLALRFCIITAARNGEARGALWDEIDLVHKVWEIPGARMKSGLPHRVPLVDEAARILETMKPLARDGLVFPGQRKDKPVSEAALRKVIKAAHDVTIHGFRSSFRDWCAETTHYPRELAEKALAHVLRDKTEAAYQRGDMFEKRRELMAAWAEYCSNHNGGDA